MMRWEQIKGHWRNEFHKSEIYTDEDSHIIVFKSNDKYTIIGYLQYNDCFWISARDYIDFIDFIKNLGNKSYNPFKIYLLCNCHLYKIKKPNEIESLPNDVDYYYVNYNWLDETIKFKRENQTESAQHSRSWEQINKRWYQKLGIPILTTSKFDDWERWSRKGYKREWYEWYEKERFESYWGRLIGYNNNFSEVYIDEGIWGFYLIYKYEND